MLTRLLRCPMIVVVVAMLPVASARAPRSQAAPPPNTTRHHLNALPGCPNGQACAKIIANTFAAASQAPETGPYTYTLTVKNTGNVSGHFNVSCFNQSQLPCAFPSPDEFDLGAGATQVVTVGYRTLGPGTFQQTHRAWKTNSADTLTVGNVTVTGASIGTPTYPIPNGQYTPGESIMVSFAHPSGINTSSLKLFVDGQDSTNNPKTVKSGGQISAKGLELLGGAHTYGGYGCALNGRCDAVPATPFTVVGPPTVWQLDDSLTPDSTTMFSPYVSGAVPLPPMNLRGCPDEVDDPEITLGSFASFTLQFSNDPSKYGLIFLPGATWIDSVYISANNHDFKASENKTCSSYTYLTDTQYDWSEWPGADPNDPLWTYYPYGDRSPGAGAPSRSTVAIAAPKRGVQPNLLPAGAINPSTYTVTLNGTTIISAGEPVPGLGVVKRDNTALESHFSMGATNALLNRYNPADPASSPNGGWNEMVATIADSTGHATSVRARFVDIGPAAVQPIQLTALRNFAHLAQGDCAAFGTFQCDGVLLTQTIPGAVTRDRDRSLHLVYRSGSQRAATVVPFEAFVSRLQQPPDSMWVWLLEDGVTIGETLRYVGAHAPDEAPTSVSSTVLVPFIDRRPVLGTGLEPPALLRDTVRTVSVVLHSFYAGVLRDDTLSQDVVQTYLTDTTHSRFGPGWALAEQSRLVLGSIFQGAPAAMWLDGDGSYEIFRKVGGVWLSPPDEAARLIENSQTNPDSARYILYLETGASVGFRPDGWQAWTADLLGNRTRYAYAASSTRLTSITDPSGIWYEFLYTEAGGLKGRDTAVVIHGSGGGTTRVASFGYDTQGQLDSVRIWRSTPQADVTRYGYDGASAFGAIIDSVIDPRSTPGTPIVTTFQYDPLYSLPVLARRPPDRYGVDSVQFRSPWRRTLPRQGYGRAGDSYPERLVDVSQLVGTGVDWANVPTDFTVDAFGGPTLVRRIAPACPLVFPVLPSCGDDVRRIARDSLGRVLRIAHQPDWPSSTDSVVYHYDAAGEIDTLIKSTLAYPGNGPQLDTLTFTYDTSGTLATGGICRRLRTMRDAMGGVTHVNYDSSGAGQCLPTTTIGLASDTTIFTYGALSGGDRAGVRPVSVRDPNGLIQSMEYDAATWNSAVSIRAGDNATNRMYYDPNGHPDSLVDPVGVRTFYRHDLSGRVLRTKTGTGANTPVTSTFYNPSGLVDSVRVYGSGDGFEAGQDAVPVTAVQTTRHYYDRVNQLDSTVTWDSTATGVRRDRLQTFLNDRVGNPIWEHPGNGSYITRAYDWQQRLVGEYLSRVEAGSAFADATTTSVYSGTLQVALGHGLNNGEAHAREYDEKGQLMYTDDGVAVSQREYSPAGLLNREVITFADGPAVTRTYTYNRRGQRTRAATAISGVTVSQPVDTTWYTYNDATARLDSIVEKVGGDSMGRVQWMFDRGGREIERHVRVDSTTGFAELVVRSVYDASGRVSMVKDSSAAGVWYNFNSPIYGLNDELTAFSVVEPGAGGGPGGVDYAGYGFTYTQDGTRRLLTSGRANDLGATKGYSWIYDVFGNRLREIRTGGVPCTGRDTSLYNGQNVLQQTLSSDCTNNAHYWTDYAGNRLAQVDSFYPSGGNKGPQQIMGYTAKNQLYFSMTPTSSLGTYDYNWHWYDGAGLRVVSQVSSQSGWNPNIGPTGTKSYYVYDGSNLVLTLVHGSSWWVRSRYVVGGVDDAPLGRFTTTISSAPENLALIADRQGTTLAAMKTNGTQETQVWWFSRNPFGSTDQFTGSGNHINTETGFAGASTPNATGGFVYLRNRWYDPSTGRFLTQDPIGLAGGVNLYSYAGNNPVTFTDPFGLCPAEDRGNCTQADAGSTTIAATQKCNLSCREEKDWAKGTSPGILDPVAIAAGGLAGAAGGLLTGAAENTVASTTAAASGGQVGPRIIGNAISGFTKHGIDQVINRGVSPWALLDAARNGATRGPLIDQFGRESLRIMGEGAEFVINLLGQVITAWPK